MIIFIAGVSGVGKSTVGEKLARLLGRPFYDLDAEVEKYYETSIERLQKKFLTMYSFREAAAKVLKYLLDEDESHDAVIALPPSRLKYAYWRVVKQTNHISIVLMDNAKNILERIRFYDEDSKPIEMSLTEDEKRYLLKEIKKNISFYKSSNQRAHIAVNIAGLNADQAAFKIEKILKAYL